MLEAGEDDEGRDRAALGIDALDDCDPLPVALLKIFRAITPLTACVRLRSANYAFESRSHRSCGCRGR